MASTATAPTPAKGHPKGLYLLFTTEMWERLSYYGMRALLVLYISDKTRGGMGWSDERALQVLGIYAGLVYFTPVLGGWIADRYLGQRLSILIGGFLMMLGQFMLAVPGAVESLFFGGLGLLIVGNGLFKPNISTMVGGLYAQGDVRRDGAFTIFYMGINLGALLAPLVCGTLGEKVSWTWGYASAGIGMGLGLLSFAFFAKRLLGDVGLAPKKVERKANVSVPKTRLTREEAQRIIVILLLLVFVYVFWAAFEQAGGLMNLYTAKKVDRHVFGWEVPTTWFQSVNPVFILLLGPLFAELWLGLGRKSKDPSIPMKMGLGLLLVSLGFVFMMGAARQSESGSQASLMWVVAAYFFHTAGELCVSPVGLSMVTKLAPARYASLLMGVWFLSNAAANYSAAIIGTFAKDLGEFQVFLAITVVTAVTGVVLLGLAPVLKRMMHGADESTPVAQPTSSEASTGLSPSA
ncbi:MAG TPA: peptide MFS transporter [Myxococcaceae bacterium]|nr:peptide MFS transporter [Myxococcaceae bacterium]